MHTLITLLTPQEVYELQNSHVPMGITLCTLLEKPVAEFTDFELAYLASFAVVWAGKPYAVGAGKGFVLAFLEKRTEG